MAFTRSTSRVLPSTFSEPFRLSTAVLRSRPTHLSKAARSAFPRLMAVTTWTLDRKAWVSLDL